MCAFATVHTVESPQEWWSRQLKLKLADAKTEQDQIAALHAHIDELVKYLDRQDQNHFRIVNLMSKKELDAYDMIAVDIWQSRQQTASGGISPDFQPSPYKMGNTLLARIRGLVANHLSPNGLVG